MGIAAELVICPSLICVSEIRQRFRCVEEKMSPTVLCSNASQRRGRFFPPIYWRSGKQIEQTVVLVDAPQL
jgi:hypothetical protein